MFIPDYQSNHVGSPPGPGGLMVRAQTGIRALLSKKYVRYATLHYTTLHLIFLIIPDTTYTTLSDTFKTEVIAHFIILDVEILFMKLLYI